MSDQESLTGIGVGSRGVVGEVFVLNDVERTLPPLKSTLPVDHELALLRSAIDATASRLRVENGTAGGAQAAIMDALLVIIEDPELLELASPALEEGWDGATALQRALEEFELMMGDDADFASRVGDLKAIAREVGRVLRGEETALNIPSEGSWVIVARDLTPMETSQFGSSVVGVITELGGPTSHTAIICRALDIPAVVSCPGALDLRDGEKVLVDPVGNRVVRGGDLSSQTQAIRFTAQHDQPLITVRANIGSLADATNAQQTQARGVGLFRTEVLYLHTSRAPSIEEQSAQYREIFAACPAGKIIVRTIDAGSDKPVPFLSLPEEENPALGIRGLRMAGRFPEFVSGQLQAIAHAINDTGRDVGVMAPMVATLEEVQSFVGLCREAGINQVGIMVETPAIIAMLADLGGLLSFVSIGTNDLSQYLFAADRLHPELGALNSPWQPGLLREVHRIARAGAGAGIPVGVCGESAANPLLSIVFAGMGIDSVSVASSAVDGVAQALRGVTLEVAQACAEAALAARTATDAEDSVRRVLADHSLERGKAGAV
jgi:phosphoenolpyruvate-protein phosphotransferase (PTS system enzyme I)